MNKSQPGSKRTKKSHKRFRKLYNAWQEFGYGTYLKWLRFKNRVH